MEVPNQNQLLTNPSREAEAALTVEAPPQAEPAVDQRAATPQENRALLAPIKSSGALSQYPKSQVLYELQNINAQTMLLLRPMVLDMESQLRVCQEELRIVSEKYQQERFLTVKLKAQLDSERKIKILQNFLLTVGGLLNAAGLKLLFDKPRFDKQNGIGIALVVCGCVLLFTGWLWPKGGKEII